MGPITNRSDLIAAMEVKGGYDRPTAEKAVQVLLDTIVTSLACGEPVVIRNFGKFEPRVRSAITRKNPVTREPIDVPEKMSVGFVPAPALKARLNRSSA